MQDAVFWKREVADLRGSTGILQECNCLYFTSLLVSVILDLAQLLLTGFFFGLGLENPKAVIL